jgi:hypothetical protein
VEEIMVEGPVDVVDVVDEEEVVEDVVGTYAVE